MKQKILGYLMLLMGGYILLGMLSIDAVIEHLEKGYSLPYMALMVLITELVIVGAVLMVLFLVQKGLDLIGW